MATNKILSDIIEFLTSSEKFRSFFLSDIRSLNQFKIVWDENKIRIGLIGITSSGKSTLVNALLGEKLLPQKVKPSSSVLVVCKFDTVKKATIYFDLESGKEEEIITKNISKELEKYGDEEFNPNNIYQVKEIHLSSPKFKLSKNISLVDSPGLDAYGMEAHEKITLQLALPTLDMILYLTTVKASSDKENLTRIDEITLDDKPLIIIQNMIDSIEPKIIRGGEESKSISEIKKENYNRLKKLLQNAAKKSTKNASILQVSALDALSEERFDISNIQSLIDTISTNELFLQERQQYTQNKQLLRKTVEVLRNIDNIDSNGDSYKDSLGNIEILLNYIEKQKGQYIADPKLIIEEFNKNNNEIITKIKKIDKTAIRKTIEQLEAYQKIKNKLESDFSNRITKIQKYIKELLEKSNLRDEDLNFKPPSPPQKKLKPPTERKKLPDRQGSRDIDSFSGKIKRGVGSIFGKKEWGREPYIIPGGSISVINKKLLENDIRNDKVLWTSWYKQINKDFNSFVKKGLDKIQAELELQKNSISEKQFTSMNSSELTDIKNRLNDYTIQLKKISRIQDKKIDTEEKEYFTNIKSFTTEISTIALNMFKIAHHNSYHQAYAIRDFCIKKMQYNEVVVWGWDSGDIEFFTDLYFNVEVHFLQNEFFISEKKDNYLIQVYNESNYIQNRDEKILNKLALSSVSLFINADISQSGFFEKKYSNSFINIFNKNIITWVIQGIDILLKNDTFIEAFVNLEYFLENIEIENYLIIVASKDPFYSLLAYELSNMKNKGVKLIADDRDIISRIGLGRGDDVRRYIRQYLEEKELRHAQYG